MNAVLRGRTQALHWWFPAFSPVAADFIMPGRYKDDGMPGKESKSSL